MAPSGRAGATGRVLEIEAPRPFVFSRRIELFGGDRAAGNSRLTYELENSGESIQLTAVHEMDKPDSQLIKSTSGGWPAILSSLKSLLETGESLEATPRSPKGI
jgi:hypothetical protein